MNNKAKANNKASAKKNASKTKNANIKTLSKDILLENNASASGTTVFQSNEDTEDIVSSPSNYYVTGTPPNLSESSSSYTESDSDSDILTPEEAFHLPPGSLSYPTGLDDDDALSGIRHSSRVCNIADEEDELIRCGSNFIMASDEQDMITRELSSPTLNQLSDFDSSLSMFLSPSDEPTTTSDSVLPDSSTCTTVCLTSPSKVINSRTLYNGAGAGSLSGKTEITNTIQYSEFKPIINTDTAAKTNSNLKSLSSSSSSSSSSSTTTLKISPLNSSSRQVQIPGSLGFTPKQTVRPLLNLLEKSTNYPVQSMMLSTKPPLVNNTLNKPTITKVTHGHSVIAKDDLGSWNKQYMEMENFNETDMLNDIAMDEETPLEKVNPDIFFSSAFPVSSASNSMSDA